MTRYITLHSRSDGKAFVIRAHGILAIIPADEDAAGSVVCLGWNSDRHFKVRETVEEVERLLRD